MAKKNFTKPQPKSTTSQILENIRKKAEEEVWEEEIEREVKELMNEKFQKSEIKSDFGRRQRNISTEPDKTVYDPDFGKPRPDPNKTAYDPDFGKPRPKPQMPSKHVVEVEKGVKPGDATRQVTPRPKSTASQILKNVEKKAAEEAWEEEIRKEVKELLDEKPQKPTKSAKPQKPGTTKLAPTKIKTKPGKGIGKVRSVLKSVGKVVAVGAVASVVGFAIIDHLGVAVFEHVADEVLRRMGPETDLSDYLPDGHNKVIWSEASYLRHSREDVGPDSLPNVLVDNVTIYPPRNGILVMGISVDGLPDFVGEININELGDGNSDWLCEKYGGYLICRSMSGAHPLNAGLKTVLTFQYHLPAYELKEMLAAGSGSRAVYFIVK